MELLPVCSTLPGFSSQLFMGSTSAVRPPEPRGTLGLTMPPKGITHEKQPISAFFYRHIAPLFDSLVN